MSGHLDKYELVAAAVCGKAKGLSHQDCYQSRKDGYPPCHGYGKCCLFEKSEQQLDFVLHPLETETFLKACPGGGKTEVVGLMAGYAMRQRAWRHQGIAVVSFTNNAAEVIRERVGRFAGNTVFPHYVGTFDSWLHGYLLNPYGYLFTGYLGKRGDRSIRIVSIDSSTPFLKHYQSKYNYAKTGTVSANQCFFDLESGKVVFDSDEEAIDAARNKIDLEAWQRDDLLNAKARFWQDGFATHQDIEFICVQLLEKELDVAKRFAARFPYVIVDECQDLSYGQLQMLESLRSQGSRVHLVGDLNQAIYSFRKVDPERVRQFIEKNKLEVLPLTKNFRSLQPIVNVCGRLCDQGTVEGIPPDGEGPVCVYFSYNDDNSIASLPKVFETFADSRKCGTSNTAVLARGRAMLRRLGAFEPIVPSNQSKRLALGICMWKQEEVRTADEALKCLGATVATWCFPNERHDSRNHSKPETLPSNIEWRLFLARVLDGCAQHPCIGNLRQPWKTWAACARKELGSILTDSWHGLIPLSADCSAIRVPPREGDASVYDSLELGGAATPSKVRITTFHQIKGETLDAALVVSSPTRRGDGGHWLHWVNSGGGNGEHQRFGYVASSRPRHLLAWAIPEPNDEEKRVLAELGFVLACQNNANNP